MSIEPPPPIDIAKLFRDPDMFDDIESFSDAGFDVIERSSDKRIMVGSHRDYKDYLFKKYNNDRPLDDQLENYQRRVDGARAIRAFAADHGLRKITAPQKWLFELPSQFSHRRHASHIVVAERLKLMDKERTAYEYGDIDKRLLKDLCLVVFNFRGLDSSIKNVPFTKDGLIAFIDTEGYGSGRDEYLRYISKYLSVDRLRYAQECIDDLKRATKKHKR